MFDLNTVYIGSNLGSGSFSGGLGSGFGDYGNGNGGSDGLIGSYVDV